MPPKRTSRSKAKEQTLSVIDQLIASQKQQSEPVVAQVTAPVVAQVTAPVVAQVTAPVVTQVTAPAAETLGTINEELTSKDSSNGKKFKVKVQGSKSTTSTTRSRAKKTVVPSEGVSSDETDQDSQLTKQSQHQSTLESFVKPVIVNLPIKDEDIDKITTGSNHYEDYYYEYNPTLNEPAAFNTSHNETFTSMPEEIPSLNGNNATEMNNSTNVNSNQLNSITSKSTNIMCQWCCHPFDNDPFGIPIKYQDKKFLTEGVFCSLECACAENFRNIESGNAVWERYNLINAFARHINYGVTISAAPPKTSLKAFGGSYSIEEYRKNVFHNRTLIQELPYPMITKKAQVAEIRNFYKETKSFIPIDIERVHKLEQKLKDSTREKDSKGIYEKMYMKLETVESKEG